MRDTLRMLPEVVNATILPIPAVDRDEILRLEFRCAALERRLDGEAMLKATITSLESENAHLASALRATRTERDGLLATMRSAAQTARHSLTQLVALDLDGQDSQLNGHQRS